MIARTALSLSLLTMLNSQAFAAHSEADQVDAHVSGKAFLAWVQENAIEFDTLEWRSFDLNRLSRLDKLLEGKRIVFLGEPDHYIREKNDFRLILIRYLFEYGWTHIGMEMGRSDGKRVEQYLQTGDLAHLDRVATFGYRGDQRPGRKHPLRGINFEANPEFWQRAWGENRWFLKQLRTLNEPLPENSPRLHWFGYDVDTRPGGGYTDARELLAPQQSAPVAREILRRLARVDGESRAAEIERLEELLRFIKLNATDVRTLLGPTDAKELQLTLRYLTSGFDFALSATNGLGSPEGRAGLIRREASMFRQVTEVLQDLPPTAKIILLGHNMHLSKKSESLRYGPVGSGAPPMWTSVGTRLAESMPEQVYSIWMLYHHGRHAKLMADTIIEQEVEGSPYALEHILVKAGSMFLLPLQTGDPHEAYLLHPHNFMMNGRPVGGIVANQADALFFVAEVHELGWQRPPNS